MREGSWMSLRTGQHEMVLSVTWNVQWTTFHSTRSVDIGQYGERTSTLLAKILACLCVGWHAGVTGRSSDKNFLKNKNILEKQLKQDKITIISTPIRASYNSPFTLPMLKRNEVMYKVNL